MIKIQEITKHLTKAALFINVVDPGGGGKAPIPLGPIRGIGPLGFENLPSVSNAPALFTNTLSKIVGVLTVAAILWFVLQIILASYSWMSAGGDAKAVENARSKLTNAIVGLIVVFFALVLASVIGFLLGIPNILDVGGFISRLSPQTSQ